MCNNEIGNCLRNNCESYFYGVKCCGNFFCFFLLLIYFLMNMLCFMEFLDICVNSKNVLFLIGLDVLLCLDCKVVWMGGIVFLFCKVNFLFIKYLFLFCIFFFIIFLNMYGGGLCVLLVVGSLLYFL